MTFPSTDPLIYKSVIKLFANDMKEVFIKLELKRVVITTLSVLGSGSCYRMLSPGFVPCGLIGIVGFKLRDLSSEQDVQP